MQRVNITLRHEPEVIEHQSRRYGVNIINATAAYRCASAKG